MTARDDDAVRLSGDPAQPVFRFAGAPPTVSTPPTTTTRGAPLVEVPAADLADDVLLNRAQATAYVNGHLHVRIGKQTLEGLASKGGGPVFRRFGNRVYYAVGDLKSWVAAATKETYASTADYREKRRQRQPEAKVLPLVPRSR